MKSTIFVNREDARQVEAEEQYKFVKANLEAMELDLGEILPDDYKDFSAERKVKLREFLDTFKIMLLDDRDGGIKILVYDENSKKKELIAEWRKCRFDLRIDQSEPDPSKRIYMAMHIDWWSVFEE